MIVTNFEIFSFTIKKQISLTYEKFLEGIVNVKVNVMCVPFVLTFGFSKNDMAG